MNIKERRMSLNLTQDFIAGELNVGRTTVSMWETGEAMPRSEKLPELARLLKCSIDDLFKSYTTKG